MKVLACWALGIAFSLSCFGGPLNFFNFDDGPSPLFTGTWVASGGNPGGYITSSATQILPDVVNYCGPPSSGCGEAASIVNVMNPFGIFAPTDYGINISFDYRASETLNNFTPAAVSPLLTVLFSQSPFGSDCCVVARVPLVANDENWTHFQISLTDQNFNGLFQGGASTQLPLLQVLELSSQFNVRGAGPGSGTATITLDIDNLSLGNGTPEPSSVVFVVSGLALFGLVKGTAHLGRFMAGLQRLLRAW